MHIYSTGKDVLNGQAAAITSRRLWVSTALVSCALITSCLFPVTTSMAAKKLVVGENTEQSAVLDDDGDIPFSISVDGETIDGSSSKPVDAQRKTDIALEKVDVQVKFDGLEVKPALNVSVEPIKRTVSPNADVNFRASSNYPDWITRGEIRVLRKKDGVGGSPLINIPVDMNSGYASWNPSGAGDDDLVYVLRVYDAEGRFDETAPLDLRVSSKEFPAHTVTEDAVAPGEGEDRTAIRNIPVHGGAVTVYGKNVPDGHRVGVLGKEVPVDNERNFVVQRILPPGDHNVDVQISGEEQSALTFDRQINIPSNDWFYVALADLTVGRKFGGSDLAAAGEEYDNTYTKGRLAFYLKGKIKGRYLLTAAADTKEGELEDIFKGFDSKDPRQLLRRIDPDAYYPVYGDGSTSVEDAPTSGKFYVRLERGDSHVMWGNFKTRITGTEFMRRDRTLYGANVVYKSESVTSFGERKFEATVYAAQPGTLPQRDSFRGTGGSAYFLKRQDISTGSETISVETRDRVTGRILSRRTMVYGKDYRINYIQGVIILNQPLSSSADTGSVVRDGALGGNQVYLVASYEYTPTATDVDGYTYGGRAETWLNDHLRVGISGVSEKTGTADQTALGADIQLRKSEKTFITGEFARSEGPGFGQTNSTDGGFLLNDQPSAGRRDEEANAYRLRAQADLEELGFGGLKGTLSAHAEQRDAGFSALGIQAQSRERIWGGAADIEINERTKLLARYDDYSAEGGNEKREADISVERRIGEKFKVRVGARHSYLTTITGVIPGKTAENGQRTDLGLRLSYLPNEKDEYYVFGQATVQKDGTRRDNDRIGVGAKKQITDKIDASAEISYGDSGLGGLVALGYSPTVDDRIYLGYKLDPDRALLSTSQSLIGSDKGALVFGTRRRINETTTAFLEHNYDVYGARRAVTETYGVTYTPDSNWTLEGGIENGELKDPYASDFTRTAVSVGGSYKTEKKAARAKLEARFEDSDDNTRDRTTWLFATGATYKTSDDWAFVAKLDAAISQSDSSAFLDGDYVSGSLGYAYRPVDNDKFNALFKYSFLYDLPGPQQVSSNGYVGPLQRSHVLSADGSYDLNRYLTLGAKYGVRIGEYALDRTNPNWETGSAHLGIIRADIHVVKKWDLLLEGRVLHTPDVESTDLGALAGIYRHVGNNFKVGVGYNFGSFSDDLTDLVKDDQGVFVNLVGKF